MATNRKPWRERYFKYVLEVHSFDIIDCITHAAVGSFVEALEFYI
jgi:hypothetical protein